MNDNICSEIFSILYYKETIKDKYDAGYKIHQSKEQLAP